MQRKNPAVAAALGFFFGAFGLFYISASQGLIALGVLVAIGVCSGGIGAPVVWIGCGFWGYIAAENYNQEHGMIEQDLGGYEGQVGQITDGSGQTGNSVGQPGGNWEQQTDGSVDGGSQYCGSCGAELRDEVAFCTSCGEEIPG